MQAVRSAAAAKEVILKELGPAELRHALHAAGNVVLPHEVEEVLAFVVEDKQFQDLHNLHLVRMRNGAVARIWRQPTPGNSSFIFIPESMREAAQLMQFEGRMLVAKSSTWQRLSR